MRDAEREPGCTRSGAGLPAWSLGCVWLVEGEACGPARPGEGLVLEAFLVAAGSSRLARGGAGLAGSGTEGPSAPCKALAAWLRGRLPTAVVLGYQSVSAYC